MIPYDFIILSNMETYYTEYIMACVKGFERSFYLRRNTLEV